MRCDRILLTHGHPDHVSGVPALKAAFGCEAAIHPDDREQLEAVHYLPGVPDDLPDVVCEQDLRDGEVLRWHGLDIEVVHTPGHTRGSVCFRIGPDLLSGDTLFHRGVGSLRSSRWILAGAHLLDREPHLYTASGDGRLPRPRAAHHGR